MSRQPSRSLLISDELRSFGYVFLPSHLPSSSTEDVVRTIGTLLRVEKGSAIHQLRPESTANSTPNTYSGIYGNEQFPLHTDLAHWRFPPRFLMLRCIKGFEAVPTVFIDGAETIETIDQTVFSRALVRPRRPIDGILPLLRLYDRQKGDRGLLRWDEVFIRPASRAGETGIATFSECLKRSKPATVSLARQGDILILDNWRMLHGRSPIPHDCQARVIERAYLEDVF